MNPPTKTKFEDEREVAEGLHLTKLFKAIKDREERARILAIVEEAAKKAASGNGS